MVTLPMFLSKECKVPFTIRGDIAANGGPTHRVKNDVWMLESSPETELSMEDLPSKVGG